MKLPRKETVMAKLIAYIAAVGAACTAHAQTGARYRLEPASQVTEQFCLGPCLCPFNQFTVPVRGIFTLTLVQHGPLFDEYRVSAVDWIASGPFAILRFAGSGDYRIGGEVALMQHMTLALSENNAEPWPYDSGLVMIDPQHPFPRISITIESPQIGCRKNIFELLATPLACAADCDVSGSLNVNDFACFLNAFAAMDPYANCDASTTPPVLNVNDFACFLNLFAAGCP
jgi:hypothetical protein